MGCAILRQIFDSATFFSNLFLSTYFSRMIQRRQSLEWLLAAVALIVYAILHAHQAMSFNLLYLPAMLCVVTILLFKNRKKQIQISKFNLIVTFLIWIIIIFQMVKNKQGSDFFTMIRVAVPVFLIWMGMKNTQKDEEKVRSIDRIR
jgi:peptidoglycan/LPS O-acetylase OafA/YrhL